MDRATEYAERVAAGEVVCGRLHRLACERHLNDLKHQDTDDFPYIWVPEKSQRVIRYAEKLTLAEGFKSEPLRLYDFQAFDLGVPFGWYNRRGFRRFKRKYKSVSRQHGKSLENGITGTYIGGFSGYRYGQLYTAATKKRQAKIVWNEMKKFIESDPDLLELFEPKDYKSTIICNETHCTIEALSKESGLDDGFRPLFASLDELHQMKDNSVYKALYNGTRNMDEALISMITTRGFDTESFAYEMDSLAVCVLEGTVRMDDMFADIFCLDEGDDPFDEKVWVKSNPIMATTERGLEQIRTEAATAKAMGGSELRDYLTKDMNMWVTKTDSTFVAPEDWNKAKTRLTLEDFRGERCWVGVDLSSGDDLTSIAIEFEHGDDGAYVYTHSFMPRGRLLEHVNHDTAPYDLWHEQGLITTMGGLTDFRTSYKFVIRHLAELVDEYELNVQGIGYDKHNADAFTEDLEQFGAPLIEVTQSARNLNDATVDVQVLVKSGQYAMDESNELMSWSFANAQIVENSFKEKKIDKKDGKRSRRIDCVDAAIDAHFCRLAQKESALVDVEAEMQSYLETMGW